MQKLKEKINLEELQAFLVSEYRDIPLFKLQAFNNNQKKLFVKNLYHIRGHFDRQLFQRAALCSIDAHDKLKKLEDLCDELGVEFEGENGIYGLLKGEKTTVKIVKSHEQLFLDFVEDVGCILENEISSYLQPKFIEEYNEKLIHILTNKDELTREVAFSAYELLDNIDYQKLYEIALKLGASQKGLIFFNVHRHSNHYKKTEEKLIVFWNQNPYLCKMVFYDIFYIQIAMWNQLSKLIINEK